MQNITFHIAYLLTQHECVIVPGLGAFIVSPFERRRASRWGILPSPENFLKFNSEISHNDDLLINSIIKERNCSFQEACTLIDIFVTQVLYSLDEEKKVHIPWVGTLYSKDDKILFQPERTLSCNAMNYGLTGISLPYVQDLLMETTTSPSKNDEETVDISTNRKFFVYAGSIAAALIAICLIPTPLNDGNSNLELTDYASIIQIPTQDTVNDEADALDETIQIPADSTITSVDTPAIQPETQNPVKKNAAFYYYIIVASGPNQTYANNSIKEFHSKGFEQAAILHTDGRYRIYINRFDDKNEAEKFLIKFRNEHPKYSTAWLLRQAESTVSKLQN